MNEMQAMQWTRKMARQIMSGDMLSDFLSLGLKDRLVGIATLAHIGGDAEVREAALELLRDIAPEPTDEELAETLEIVRQARKEVLATI